MNMSALIAPAIAVLFALGLVAYRLFWAASSVASATGLGRMPALPKNWRRWLMGEQNKPTR
jgi:hypothetical protein